jgi:hypothetical protein
LKLHLLALPELKDLQDRQAPQALLVPQAQQDQQAYLVLQAQQELQAQLVSARQAQRDLQEQQA